MSRKTLSTGEKKLAEYLKEDHRKKNGKHNKRLVHLLVFLVYLTLYGDAKYAAICAPAMNRPMSVQYAKPKRTVLSASPSTLMHSDKHNRLIHEKSPYLLQHAHNPVDWYPWGDEAFEKAQQESKPIFLSIGYSTCHWCHVMERESFEDDDVANLLNEHFVSIKVDREERPDIDHVYMTVCQLMTGTGGWPLTIIMTPDKEPFFAATYIPKETRYGRKGLMTLLPEISTLWQEKRADLRTSAGQVVETLRKISADVHGADLDTSVLKNAFNALAQTFDREYGGFGSAPKFPTPHNLSFLLRYWKRSGNKEALNMVEQTLEAMRLGGIFDHLGYGFHRYSTDEHWRVPHFEKMLYDQALLLLAYSEAYQVSTNPEFEKTAHEICTYVLRDMTTPQGGFYSAEDADSEGEEGKFYLWSAQEIKNVLAGDARFFNQIFNIKNEGNFLNETTRKTNGKNILYLESRPSALAERMNISCSALNERIESARVKLVSARDRRVRPHKDDKILTSWNGLMIAALARAGGVFDKEEYVTAARSAAVFILEHLRSSQGRLLHRYRDNNAALQASADDYAFFIWGLLELYHATFDTYFLKTALELNAQFIDHYWDQKNGGFFFTADDGEEVLVRQKHSFDGALPSANSVALQNLLSLSRMTANQDLEKIADRLIKAFAPRMSSAPTAHTQFLSGVSFALGPTYEVIVVGNVTSHDTHTMFRRLRQLYAPNMVLIFKPTDTVPAAITQLAEYTTHYGTLEDKTTVYVCSNYVCQQPTTNPTTVLEQLGVKQE